MWLPSCAPTVPQLQVTPLHMAVLLEDAKDAELGGDLGSVGPCWANVRTLWMSMRAMAGDGLYMLTLLYDG